MSMHFLELMFTNSLKKNGVLLFIMIWYDQNRNIIYTSHINVRSTARKNAVMLYMFKLWAIHRIYVHFWFMISKYYYIMNDNFYHLVIMGFNNTSNKRNAIYKDIWFISRNQCFEINIWNLYSLPILFLSFYKRDSFKANVIFINFWHQVHISQYKITVLNKGTNFSIDVQISKPVYLFL